jgi:hypothetical protein
MKKSRVEIERINSDARNHEHKFFPQPFTGEILEKKEKECEAALALRENQGFEHVGAGLLVRSKQLEQVRD